MMIYVVHEVLCITAFRYSWEWMVVLGIYLSHPEKGGF